MNKKKIGILGGMGPEALSDMYLEICEYYQKNFGAKYDKDFPPIIMYSVPIPDVVESIENETEILNQLVDASKTLQEDRCDFIVIACNSVQFLLNDIRAKVSIPVIGIAETVAKELAKENYKKVGILATQTTIKKEIYNEELAKIGVAVVIPNKENQEIVTNVIMTQLAGKTTAKETEKLKTVIDALKQNGAEAVLIACTDLPLVITQKDTEMPLINCTKIYAYETAKLSSS